MKSLLYAGIFSALLSNCTKPKTTFVDHPVVIEGIESTYTVDSEGNCFLTVPEADRRTLHLYNENCDKTAEVISRYFREYREFHHERHELNERSRHFIDSLFRKAEDNLEKKNKLRSYNDLPF